MNIPEELTYSRDHEWIRVEGDNVRIGITDFAQDNLGDVVYVQIPEAGASVAAGDSFSEVESTKSVSDIYAPLAGTIAEVNAELEATPELLNQDPYGEGWICVLTPSDIGDVEGLLDAAGYRELISD
jgi:glycine cleavage system H protein